MQALNLKQLSVRELEAALAPHGGTPVAALKVFSLLWPGQARAFRLSELESAKRWAAEDGG